MPKRRYPPETASAGVYPYSPDAIVQRYHELREQRELTRARTSTTRRRLGAAAMTLGVLATPPAAVGEMIYRDIQHGKAELAYDQAEVHTIHEYDGKDELYEHHGTFVLTGFGTKDPSETAQTLDAHKETGSVFAVEYSNNSFDIRDLAERVVEAAREQDVMYLSLDGYSLGGLAGAHIAAYIHKHVEDLYVVNVIMNSSPIERDDLTNRSQSALAPIEWITDKLPDLLYSEKLRKPVEIINRNDRYIEKTPDKPRNYRISGLNSIVFNGTRYTLNFDRLLHESGDVDRVMADDKKASAWLMGMQIDILERNIDEALETLSEPKEDDDDDTLPNIIYTGSKNSSDDPVVDPHSSSQRLEQLMEKYPNNLYVVLGDVQHANPAEARSAYAEMQRGKLRQVTRQNLTARETTVLAQLESPHLDITPN